MIILWLIYGIVCFALGGIGYYSWLCSGLDTTDTGNDLDSYRPVEQERIER